MTSPIAVVGAGLVGAGWAIVFARAGHDVRLYDGDEKIRATALDGIRANLEGLQSFDLINDAGAVADRIAVHGDLASAVAGVSYVQESVFETIPVKHEVTQQLDEACSSETVIGSSSSGIPASAFTENLKGRSRCLIAHPVNPPYLVPLVELVPAPWTHSGVIDSTFELMESVGQSPIRIDREVEGFVLNRLQGALLNEAWALFEEGYASAGDIDKTVSEGLGLRWSFMGPFQTIDLNAPGGVSDYAARLSPLYHAVAESRTDPQRWSDALVACVEHERRQHVSAEGLKDRREWRDRRLMALAAHKAKASKKLGD
ncbi:MAG: 3-hydroxyacyl-CoA dehydrogenase [Rhodospirillaceae bacterium]|jgi:L-gulonate 3-dehydrogenase|nr:3-hydroxyacyl-CoA dehydrogenase [Rhodospirillaceae bacterium]